MSLKAWKLELCNSSTTTTTTTPPTSAPSTASTPSPTDLQSHRIPPRSSLAQQLRRLNSLLPDAPSIGADLNLIKDNGVVLSRTNDRDPDDDGSVASTSACASDADGVLRKTRPLHPSFPCRPAPPVFVPDLPRGPFEPLLLSPPGDPHVVQVPPAINCRLLEHQREGVKFLYNLYWSNVGGILGDDMGLGKTIQTIAFLAAVIGKDSEKEDQHNNSIFYFHPQGPALIVCPTSVIQNWAKEFSEWGEFSFSIYHGPNCDLIIEKLTAKSIDIIITSYDTFRIHANILCDIQWDVVIVDEAHRLKNEKSRLYEACLGFKTRRRYGLTGTIMQNKILELFNLFDWVAPGSLGTREHFREFYDEPLKHGQRLSAPKRFVQIADERKKHLSSLLGKYLLRRTKEETIGHLMFGKEDNVVFCTMSNLQKRAYRRMLDQPEIQCLINKDLPCACGSPLKQVECCKRVVPNGILWSYLHRDNPDGCDSCPFCLVLPCIIKLQQISNHLELIKPNPKDEPEKQKKDAEFASAILGTDVSLIGGNVQSENFMELSNAEHCGKMRALEKLTSTWVSEGDKILLFSYSVRMMDILEKFLVRKGYGFSRLDGSTPMSLRQSLVDEFNKSPSKQIFLVSTRAGGLGLNLVSANRVVIFDPNWNPAHDLQAQDRSFRYGQKRRVVVFRLLAAGSVEELVYSRQIYKQQLSNIAVSGKMEKRYFEGVQDCKEFQGELFGICNLFRDLSDKLFTSEIFELNENQLRDSSGSTDKKDAYTASAVDGRPQFNNLGIIYSHRNEDVVNMAPNPPGKDDAQILCPSDSVKPVKRKSATVCLRGRSGALCDEQKRKEYTVLAQSMGMDELKFSKWVLSASVTELEKLLDNHRLPRSKACAMSDCAG